MKYYNLCDYACQLSNFKIFRYSFVTIQSQKKNYYYDF